MALLCPRWSRLHDGFPPQHGDRVLCQVPDEARPPSPGGVAHYAVTVQMTQHHDKRDTTRHRHSRQYGQLLNRCQCAVRCAAQALLKLTKALMSRTGCEGPVSRRTRRHAEQAGALGRPTVPAQRKTTASGSSFEPARSKLWSSAVGEAAERTASAKLAATAIWDRRSARRQRWLVLRAARSRWVCRPDSWYRPARALLARGVSSSPPWRRPAP